MAVTVHNSGTTSIASASNTIDVFKPSGLVAGDLMIGHVYFRANADTTTFNVVADGFAVVTTVIAANVAMGVWWKIATAGDTSATTFQFGINGTAVNGLGRMWRISGHDAETPINEWNSASGTSADVTVGGITPAVADSLIMLLHGASDDTGAVSGWAIATSNPASWSEAYDVNGGLSNALIAAAAALRPETTATGNATWTGATSESWGGVILAVAPPHEAGGGGGGGLLRPRRRMLMGIG